MSKTQPGPDDLPTSAGATSDDVTSGGEESSGLAAQIPVGKIGRYTITRLIGEGGMGAVYEAEQDQPRRTVALKVIKPGLASPELLRRFAQESQALGRLQHPGIAQIYEAGTADTGYCPQPYFAMEFIRGETLREYASKLRLSARQRLEIVAKVCDAVHHAHQRGLIHRDLKPGNILVDETGQPKILDFGVARVTDSDAQATMQTDVGQLVGTLAYMSPEQVLADPLELDIRSDVYALGVILYELLAGRLPYNISRKIHEALQAIREEDPSKLSSINRTYRGDIETIAAKALEKDKTRRYASAAELAADIRHYLKDEPIVARPPSMSYQLQKFARRNKAFVIGLAAVFAVLIVGGVAATWQAVRATRAEAAAVRDRDRAAAAEQTATLERDKALTARTQAVASEVEAVASEARAKLERDKAVAEKERADTESATAKAVTEFLQKNLFEQVTGPGGQRGAGQDGSVSGALDRAAAKIDGAFPKQPLVEAGVREAVAGAYQSLALFDRATDQLNRALALRRRSEGQEAAGTLKTMHTLAIAYVVQRKTAEAESLLAPLFDTQKRKLGAEHPETLKSELDLAAVYVVGAKAEKAEPLATHVFEVRRRTAGIGNKDTIGAMVALASIYALQKKTSQAATIATAAYDASLKTFGENDQITVATRTLARTFNVIVTPPPTRGSENSTARAVLGDLSKVLDDKQSTSLPELINTAKARATLATVQGHGDQAEATLLEVLEAVRRAGTEDLELWYLLVDAYGAQKKFADAEATLRKLVENPAASTPRNAVFPAAALRSLAGHYRRDGKFVEAEPHLLKLVSSERVTPGEGVQQTRIDMGALAENYVGQRKFAEAEAALNQLLNAQRRYTGPEAANTMVTVANIGWVRLQQKRFAEAEATFREAAGVLRSTTPNAWERFNVDSMLGASLAAQKKFDEAEPLLTSGYEGMGTAARAANANSESRFTRAQAGEAIVQLYADWKKPEKQAEWAAKTK